MKERFFGDKGAPLLLDAMKRQKSLVYAQDLVEQFISVGEVVGFKPSEPMIVEGGTDNDAFFILAGAFDLKVKGRKRGTRTGGDLVGELVGADPTKIRMASLVAIEISAALKVSAVDFMTITKDHAGFWRALQEQTADRLRQQHQRGSEAGEKPHVVLFSSREANKVMGEVITNLDRMGIATVEAWDQIFAISSYPINALVDALKRADFAIAIATADDAVVSRGKASKAPRDNINFEHGLSVGTLGIDRAVLMVEVNSKIKMPSDFGGLTVVPFQRGTPNVEKSSIRAACEKIREHVEQYGVKPD